MKDDWYFSSFVVCYRCISKFKLIWLKKEGSLIFKVCENNVIWEDLKMINNNKRIKKKSVSKYIYKGG